MSSLLPGLFGMNTHGLLALQTYDKFSILQNFGGKIPPGATLCVRRKRKFNLLFELQTRRRIETGCANVREVFLCFATVSFCLPFA